MSGIFVVTPLMLAAPVVLAAATSAASSLGFNMVAQEAEKLIPQEGENTVGFDIDEAEGLFELLQEKGTLVLQREDATVVLQNKKNMVHMEVRGLAAEEELEALGRQLLDSVTQYYAYDRVVSDLKQRGFEHLEETVDEDGTIRLKLRRWDS